MTHPDNREHQARFAARVREQGLVKICEWIPAECRDTFKRIAREMRDAPPERREPPPDTADRVRQANGWGWTHEAIAAYAGIGAGDVKRILETWP
jgi:hypothetical protein